MGSLLVSWKKWCLKSGLKVYTGVSGHRLKLNLDLTRLTIVDTLFNDQLAWNGWCMEKIFFPITLEIFEASSGFLGSAKPNVHYTQWESQTAENAPEKLELQLGEKKKKSNLNLITYAGSPSSDPAKLPPRSEKNNMPLSYLRSACVARHLHGTKAKWQALLRRRGKYLRPSPLSVWIIGIPQ